MLGEPSTNAAVELLLAAIEHLNSLDGPPTRTTVMSDDVTFEDRRSGGVTFGRIDSSGWLPFIASMWEVADGQPHHSVPEVVAVRGERCAATVFVYEFGDNSAMEEVLCLRLASSLRAIDRMVAFDVDAVDEAIAQLDRWHAEIGD